MGQVTGATGIIHRGEGKCSPAPTRHRSELPARLVPFPMADGRADRQGIVPRNPTPADHVARTIGRALLPDGAPLCPG